MNTHTRTYTLRDAYMNAFRNMYHTLLHTCWHETSYAERIRNLHTHTYINSIGTHIIQDSQTKHTWFMALFSQVSTATPTCRRRSNRASAFNFIVFGERKGWKVKKINYITALHTFFVLVLKGTLQGFFSRTWIILFKMWTFVFVRPN